MRKIFEEYDNSATFGCNPTYSIDQRLEAIELSTKLGFSGAARQTNIARSTLLLWVDILCTDPTKLVNIAVPVPNPKTLPLEEAFPYLHMLETPCAAIGKTLTGRNYVSGEFKREAVAYFHKYGMRAAEAKFNTPASSIQNWVIIARKGKPRTQTATHNPVQYGLKDLSPLAHRVQELELENAELKRRLAFIEKFSRPTR